MPVYSFRCLTCGEMFDKLQKIADASPACPKGHDVTQKQISTPAFNFTNGVGTSTGLRMNIAKGKK